MLLVCLRAAIFCLACQNRTSIWRLQPVPKFALSISLAVTLVFGSGTCFAQTHIRNLENDPNRDINWMMDLEHHKILDRQTYLTKLEKLRMILEGQIKGKTDAKLVLESRIRLLAVYKALGLTAKASALASEFENSPSESGNYVLQDYYRGDKAKLVEVLRRSYEMRKQKIGPSLQCAELVRIADLYYELNDMGSAEKHYKEAYSIALNSICHPARPGDLPYSVELGAFNAYACFLADQNRIEEARVPIEKAFGYWEAGNQYSLSTGYGGFDDFGAFLTLVKKKSPALFNKLYKRWQMQIAKSPAVGILAKDGREITPPRFISVSAFSEGLAVAQDRLTHRFGYVDKTGAWKLPPTFIDANPFSQGTATAVISHSVLPVDTTGQYASFSLIDAGGKEVKNLGDSYASPFEGNIFVTSKSKHSRGCHVVSNIVDRSGEVLFSGLFDSLWEKNGHHYSLFTPTFSTASGCVISQGGYMIAFSVVRDEARKGHFRLIQEDWDPSSKDKLQEQLYDYFGQVINVRQTKDDTCRIGWDNNVTYLLDRAGKKISKNYGQIERLSTNCFKVYQESHGRGLIDATGAVLVAPKYDEIRVMSYGMAAFQMKQKWGFVNNKGQEVVPAKYDEVGDFHDAVTFYKRK
ncbi:MAG: hypothetical protein C0508_06450 [Cyanobacteria bacterium PR.023]|nr:hypothetical protein [Cyanobacteria bacterium PR.023]